MQQNTVYVGLGGGCLWQLANREHPQTMSYILDTPDGKTIVIDGGETSRHQTVSRRRDRLRRHHR